MRKNSMSRTQRSRSSDKQAYHLQGPHQVWYSDLRFVNPRSRSVGAGQFQFQYLTEDDEELARLNLGSEQDKIMPDNPTAEDIWTCGLACVLRAEVIDLISNSEDEPEPNRHGWVVTAAKARQCDPTNGGPGTKVDQSGTPGKAKYYPATKNGQNVVADRSPAIRD
ncbi:hypothetical protein LTR95_001557 [Oleoguttula sp. CCFEE 5521]